MQNSFDLKNYGWGSHARFFPGCSNAVIFFAHRALFIVDIVRQKYTNFYEAPEHFHIDYEAVAIDENGAAYNCIDGGGVYYYHVESEKNITIARDMKPKMRMPLVCYKGNLAYAAGTGIQICSIKETPSVHSIQDHIDQNSKLLFHPSGSFIVSMNSERVSAYRINSGIKMWDIKPSEWFTRNDFWEFTPDGRYLILCPYEEQIRICNPFMGKVLAYFRKGNDDNVTDAHLNPEGNLLISSSCDGKVRVWDFEKALRLAKNGVYNNDSFGEDISVLKGSLMGHKETSVFSVSPSPDFKFAISYTRWDKTFYLWDLENYQLLDQLSYEHPVDDYKILWNGSNARLFVAENTDGGLSFERVTPSTAMQYIRISETLVV